MEGCNRRKVVCALASASGIAGLAALFAVSSGSHQHQKHRYNSKVTFAYNFSESDILFVIGTSFVSSLIRASQVPFIYTHAGLLVKEDDKLVIIDSDYDPEFARDGILVHSVENFVRKYDQILVLSNTALLPDQRRLISQAALRFRGKTFDLALEGDADELYCTEMVARSLMTIPNSPISFGSDGYLTPASLHDTLLAKGWTSQVVTNRPDRTSS